MLALGHAKPVASLETSVGKRENRRTLYILWGLHLKNAVWLIYSLRLKFHLIKL